MLPAPEVHACGTEKRHNGARRMMRAREIPNLSAALGIAATIGAFPAMACLLLGANGPIVALLWCYTSALSGGLLLEHARLRSVLYGLHSGHEASSPISRTSQERHIVLARGWYYAPTALAIILSFGIAIGLVLPLILNLLSGIDEGPQESIDIATVIVQATIGFPLIVTIYKRRICASFRSDVPPLLGKRIPISDGLHSSGP